MKHKFNKLRIAHSVSIGISLAAGGVTASLIPPSTAGSRISLSADSAGFLGGSARSLPNGNGTSNWPAGGPILPSPTTWPPLPTTTTVPTTAPPTTAQKTSKTTMNNTVINNTAGLASIRICESGGNYRAVSANGRYFGAYQFDLNTWQSVGGTGNPAAASPAEQDARAARLKHERGNNPWPNCT